MADIPMTMLYQAADEPNPLVWGRKIAIQIIPEDEVEAALASGWFRHPDQVEEPKRRTKAEKVA